MVISSVVRQLALKKCAVVSYFVYFQIWFFAALMKKLGNTISKTYTWPTNPKKSTTCYPDITSHEKMRSRDQNDMRLHIVSENLLLEQERSARSKRNKKTQKHTQRLFIAPYGRKNLRWRERTGMLVRWERKAHSHCFNPLRDQHVIRYYLFPYRHWLWHWCR